MTVGGATEDEAPATVVIAGAGIGGLCLALALNKHCGIPAAEIEVFEQARAFTDDAGGAIGLYANGLRVLRDISPELLASIRTAGYDYIYRRWLRHDGSEVACAKESALTDDADLQSIGIRRWRLQKALLDAATTAGIVVRFQTRVEAVGAADTNGVEVRFSDGRSRRARLVFGADGVKSKVREAVVGKREVEYTGVTVLMGTAKVPASQRGICFPASSTTKNHACFYPVGEAEQVFQLYYPAPSMADEVWGTLSAEEGAKQCAELATKLRADGWHERFLEPLESAEAVIRLGLFAPDEPLRVWVSEAHGRRVVLLGDAAHPPVPYIGQGAMMAIEDVGVLALLLKECCCGGGAFDPSDANISRATTLYEAMRVPRTTAILGSSHKLGATQQQRANSWLYNVVREWTIKLEVAVYGTLAIMRPAPAYDYAADVAARVAASAKA